MPRVPQRSGFGTGGSAASVTDRKEKYMFMHLFHIVSTRFGASKEIAIKLFSSRTVTASSATQLLSWAGALWLRILPCTILIICGLALKAAEVPSIGCNLFRTMGK